MFNSLYTDQSPSAGKILLSEPYLGDDNFHRTVVLLCEHDEDGTVGFVLNRLCDAELKDLVAIDTVLHIPVYLGGPVGKNTLHYIHQIPDLIPGGKEIAEGIWWSGDFDRIKELLHNNMLPISDVRFFLGYSGWGEGQLVDELKEQTWILQPALAKEIFSNEPEKLWQHLLRERGGLYKVVSLMPENPEHN